MPEEQKKQEVDSTVKILGDIGMSGITSAADTVNQLTGQESSSVQSKLHTLTIDQMRDEVLDMQGSIVLIEVELRGKGAAGDVNGNMQVYLSREIALGIANDLLCNSPEAACKDFNEDVISTLKETVNIFSGQYVSAISEFVGVPILLGAPVFKSGVSAQIAESVMKNISGKVDFALATSLAFGNNKTGRLFMLLDPNSMNMILTKLM